MLLINYVEPAIAKKGSSSDQKHALNTLITYISSICNSLVKQFVDVILLFPVDLGNSINLSAR
jgi:hypothetical protein